MAEITGTAYQDIRDYIQGNWSYIALKSDVNAEIMRIKTDDSRVKWLHGQGAQTLILELRLTGLDFKTKPQKISKVELYKESSGGTPLVSESFTTVTIEVDADKITINLSIQVPQVA